MEVRKQWSHCNLDTTKTGNFSCRRVVGHNHYPITILDSQYGTVLNIRMYTNTFKNDA